MRLPKLLGLGLNLVLLAAGARAFPQGQREPAEGPAQGVTEPSRRPPPPLRFGDRFGRTAAAGYEVSGAVRWEAEGLRLGPAATLARSISARDAAWASATLMPITGAEDLPWEVRLELSYADTSVDRVVIRRQMPGRQAGWVVQLIAERPSATGPPNRLTLFEAVRPASDGAVTWQLRCTQGVLAVLCGETVLAERIPAVRFALPQQVRLVQSQGESRCQSMEFRADGDGPPREEEVSWRQQATTHLLDFRRASVQRDTKKAAAELRAALALAEKHLPDPHGTRATLWRALAQVGLEESHSRAAWERARDEYQRLVGQENEEYLRLLIMCVAVPTDADAITARAKEARTLLDKLVPRDQPRFGSYLYDLGWNIRSRNLHALAQRYLQESFEVRRQLLGEQHPHVAGTLNAVALTQQDQGHTAEARTSFEQALALFRAIGDPQVDGDLATVLTNLGWLLGDRLGDFGPAEQHLLEALEIRRRLYGPKSGPYYVTRNALGVTYRQARRFAEAEQAFLEALACARELFGDKHEDVASVLTNLAWVHIDQNQLREAKDDAWQALQALALPPDLLRGEEQGDINVAVLRSLRRNAIHALETYAEVCTLLGDLPSTLPCLHLLSKYAAAVHGEQSLEAVSALARSAEKLNRLDAALWAAPFLDQAEAVLNAGKLWETPQGGHVAYVLAQNRRLRRDFAAARAPIEMALRVERQASGEKTWLYARALNEQGCILMEVGDTVGACEALRRGLDLFLAIEGERGPNTMIVGENLGIAFLRSGRGEEAVPPLRQALELRRAGLRQSVDAANEAQLLTAATAYRKCTSSFLSAARQAAVPADEAYAAVLQVKGVAALEQRRRRWLRDQPDLAPQFARLTDITRRIARLHNILAAGEAKPADTTALTSLYVEKQTVEQEIVTRGRAFRREQGELERPVAALQGVLPRDAVLIDFASYVDYEPAPAGRPTTPPVAHLAAFVVRREGPVIRVELGPLAPIAHQLAAWRTAITRGGGFRARGLVRVDDHEEGTRHPESELKERVWKPLESHLAETQLVLISPDEVLATCPWGALPGREPGTFLLQDLAVAVVPVPLWLTDLFADESPSPPSADESGKLLLVGDVDFTAAPGRPTVVSAEPLALQRGSRSPTRRPVFAPLPGTAREIEQVERLYAATAGRDSVEVLRGAEAREEAVRRRLLGTRYLHIATHGFVALPEATDDAAPADSPAAARQLAEWLANAWHPDLFAGLALTGANRPARAAAADDGAEGVAEDDGLLTAAEVAASDLRSTQLVVLSACETGLGRMAQGEGLLGLQRSFHVSGARSVVASLWQVDDAATQVLMVEFYRNLWERRLPKLEALRQAQLALLRGDLDRPAAQPLEPPLAPKYWAAFVLSGDWR